MARMKSLLFLSTLVLFVKFVSGNNEDEPTCYFSIEHQGTFLMQEQLFAPPPPPTSSSSIVPATSPSKTISYSEITIEADSIPIWGRCYRKRGNLVIFKDSTGREDCMRCVHLTLKTPNVVQIFSEGLARCYTNEEAARARCPTDLDVRKRANFKEILLFRKHVPGGLQSLEHRFCPFNGKYRFSYVSSSSSLTSASNQNYKYMTKCDSSSNEAGNCPHGDALGIKFRGCSFPNQDFNFLCLGDWDTPTTAFNGDRFLALMDLRDDPELSVPKYRCGLYREEPNTGRIFMSLSSDSTCATGLKNSSFGHESFIMTPAHHFTSSSQSKSANIPFPSFVDESMCRFPEWTQSKWESSTVEGNTFTFKDEHNNYQTLTSKCIMRQTSTSNDRFVVYSQTQCGDQSYRCVWFKRRSPNIMEFQFGQETTSYYDDKLCDDKQFPTNNWITQGSKYFSILVGHDGWQ